MIDANAGQTWQPLWFDPEAIYTIIVAFPDVYGRLLGKRVTCEHFAAHTVRSGMDACSYLLTVDVDMEARGARSLPPKKQAVSELIDTLRMAIAKLCHE